AQIELLVPAAVEPPTSKPIPNFRQIAEQAADRGFTRVVPIAVGGKNPLIKWVAEPIGYTSTEEWAPQAKAWRDKLAAEWPAANACIVADEMCFIDADTAATLKTGYEARTGKPFPTTYTTTSRPDHDQIYFLQTAATSKRRNLLQFKADGIELSFRQFHWYVLAAGCVHPKGSIYTVTVDAPVVPMPDDLLEYISHLYSRNEGLPSSAGTTDFGGNAPEFVKKINEFIHKDGDIEAVLALVPQIPVSE